MAFAFVGRPILRGVPGGTHDLTPDCRGGFTRAFCAPVGVAQSPGFILRASPYHPQLSAPRPNARKGHAGACPFFPVAPSIRRRGLPGGRMRSRNASSFTSPKLLL